MYLAAVREFANYVRSRSYRKSLTLWRSERAKKCLNLTPMHISVTACDIWFLTTDSCSSEIFRWAKRTSLPTMSDSILNRRSRSFGVHKPHYLPNLHRMNSCYFRSRSKRGSVTRNRARVRNVALPARKEPKNTPWLPGDDYLLINSVVMTCNLSEVFHTVRFAHFYTEKEIEARWRALLFDPIVSSTSLHAVSELPPAVKAKLDRLVPFSSYEDNLLAQISFLTVFPDGVLKPMLLEDLQDSIFSRLLKEHPSVFYAGRDEVDLFHQWSRFQSCRVIKKGSPNTATHNLSNGIEKPEDVQMATKPAGAASNAGCFANPTNVTSLNSPLGGDPESFSDTELLLEETVSGALAAGVDKLTEASATARRHRMLGQSSYHGFQAHVTQCVLAALARHKHESVSSFAESLPTQSNLSASSSTSSVHLPNAALANPMHSSNRTTQPSVAFSSHRNSYFGENMRTIPRPKEIYSVETVTEINDSFDLQRRLELYRRRRRLWARLRRSAEEANRWTRLVEIRATKGLELTDCQPIYPALAALTGSRTRFLIKEQEVIFGRSSFVYKPHIDLSLEGDATRVSRCHGRIRLTTDGTFWLANFSPHTVFVDGNPVLTDEEVELRDLATVVIARLTFRFDINCLYVSGLCDHSTVAAKDHSLEPVPPSVCEMKHCEAASIEENSA